MSGIVETISRFLIGCVVNVMIMATTNYLVTRYNIKRDDIKELTKKVTALEIRIADLEDDKEKRDNP